jgi:hypothetical protein
MTIAQPHALHHTMANICTDGVMLGKIMSLIFLFKSPPIPSARQGSAPQSPHQRLTRRVSGMERLNAQLLERHVLGCAQRRGSNPGWPAPRSSADQGLWHQRARGGAG